MIKILLCILFTLFILLLIKYTWRVKILTFDINSLFNDNKQLYYIKDNSIITLRDKTSFKHVLLNGIVFKNKIHVLTDIGTILIIDIDTMKIVDKVSKKGLWIGVNNNEFWVGRSNKVYCYNTDWELIGFWKIPKNTFGMWYKNKLYLQTGNGYLLKCLIEPTAEKATVLEEIPVPFNGDFTIVKNTINGINLPSSFIIRLTKLN